MTDLQISAAQPANPESASLEAGSAAGTMTWNHPGMANLWGLATAKDSLRYWLQRKSFSSFILTRWVFAIYFVTVALNGFLVLNRVIFAGEGTELATYPAATALVLLVVLATTKERSQGLYFWSAWSFWIFFNMLGFVNATNIYAENFRVVLQILIKSWISVIGIPWMAFRIISPDKLPRYTKLLILASTVGSIMCLLQTANPNLFSYIRFTNIKTMRGAGTWDNANYAALVLMLSLFMTRLVNWPAKWMSWSIYLILLAGFVGTFSRGALIGFFVGEIVYFIAVRNYKRMFFAGSFLAIFTCTWIAIGFLVENNTLRVESKEIRDRLMTVSNLIGGKGTEELEKGRVYIWRAAIQDVLDRGNLLFGLGHTGMIKSKIGLATHNDYIQYFADAGLLGFMAYLGFISMLIAISWRCRDRMIRACLLSMIIAYAVFAMSCNSVLSMQMIGPYIAIIVLWSHYSREYPGAAQVHRLKKALIGTQHQANPPSAKFA